MAINLPDKQIKIEGGDTLYNIYGQNWKQLSGYVGDPTKLQIGTILPAPDLQKPTTSAIGQNQAIESSDLARNQYKQDTEKLSSLEAGIGGTPTLTEKPQEGAVLPQEKLAITFKSSNPAFQSVLDQTNETIKQFQAQGGTLTPEMQQQLNNVNNFQFQKTQAIADARTAADTKDATKLNEAIVKANKADTDTKTEIETLRENLKTQQETYLATLTPTIAETELKRKLITLRTERKLMPLELRKEGISAIGIGGRIIEDERTRAIQEGNLLAEIGLEQESRQFKTLSAEKQLGFIRDDLVLQQKIDEKLKENERQVIQDAQNLSKDSISVLSNIVNEFGDNGYDWQDIGQNPQAQVDILNMIKPYSGLTVDIISSALKVAKQQKIFENALKIAQETRLSEKEKKDKEIKLTPENKRDLAGAGYNPQDISDIEKSVNDFGIEATLNAIDDKDKRLIVAEKYNAQTILERVESEIEAKTKPIITKKWYQFWK